MRGNNRKQDSYLPLTPPYTAPTAPLNLTGVALNTTVIRLVWEPPQTPNGIVIRYTVHYNNGTSANANSMSVTAPAMTTDIDGLTPDTNYTFALTATNGAAESVNSSEVTIATPGTQVITLSTIRSHEYVCEYCT